MPIKVPFAGTGVGAITGRYVDVVLPMGKEVLPKFHLGYFDFYEFKNLVSMRVAEDDL